MTEEIFGPVLPIITVSGLDEAIGFINEREKPLVVYVFSHDKKVNSSPPALSPVHLLLVNSFWHLCLTKQLIRRVITETSSGALLANDCLVHATVSALPFGGVGECVSLRDKATVFVCFGFFFSWKSPNISVSSGNSGMGCYQGRHGFDRLSHLRSCLIKKLNMEAVNSMRYPPHTAKKMGWVRFFLFNQVSVCRLRRMALLTLVTVVAGFLVQVKRGNKCCIITSSLTLLIISAATKSHLRYRYIRYK